MTFGLLPEVEMAMATSPGLPSASIWRAKMRSKPRSLPAAVSAELSVVKAMAAMAARFGLVADGQFGREMLGVGGAAAIAEQHQLAAAADRRDAGADQAGEGGAERAFRLARNVVMLGEFGFEEGGEIHFMRPRRGIPAPRRAAPCR